MKTQEAVALIGALARSYDTVVQPRAGMQSVQGYEISSILKAMNTLADKISNGESAKADDDIPF
jgi:hypothetical protein